MAKKFKDILILGTDLALFLGADSTGENPDNEILLAMYLGGSETKPLKRYPIADIVDIQYEPPRLFKKGTLDVFLKDNQRITQIEYKDKSMTKQIERLIAIVL